MYFPLGTMLIETVRCATCSIARSMMLRSMDDHASCHPTTSPGVNSGLSVTCVMAVLSLADPPVGSITSSYHVAGSLAVTVLVFLAVQGGFFVGERHVV